MDGLITLYTLGLIRALEHWLICNYGLAHLPKPNQDLIDLII